MSGDDLPDDWQGPPAAGADTRQRLDMLLSMLADQRRRDLLYHLAETDVTDVGTVARLLAAKHEGVQVDEISSDVREQIQTDLVHSHLPKLADAGAIDYDPRSEAIRCTDMPPNVDQLLTTCTDIEVKE